MNHLRRSLVIFLTAMFFIQATISLIAPTVAYCVDDKDKLKEKTTIYKPESLESDTDGKPARIEDKVTEGKSLIPQAPAAKTASSSSSSSSSSGGGSSWWKWVLGILIIGGAAAAAAGGGGDKKPQPDPNGTISVAW